MRLFAKIKTIAKKNVLQNKHVTTSSQHVVAPFLGLCPSLQLVCVNMLPPTLELAPWPVWLRMAPCRYPKKSPPPTRWVCVCECLISPLPSLETSPGPIWHRENWPGSSTGGIHQTCQSARTPSFPATFGRGDKAYISISMVSQAPHQTTWNEVSVRGANNSQAFFMKVFFV